VAEVAAAVGVSRQTLHAWLAQYESGGLEGLADGSHRPRSSPHQMPCGGVGVGAGEATLMELGGSRSPVRIKRVTAIVPLPL